MICMLCGRQFIIKRGIKGLLEKQRYFICDPCYKRNPIEINLSKIPLDGGYFVNIISILPNDSKAFTRAYINEYSLVCSKYSSGYMILEDRLYIDNLFIKRMECISRLIENNVTVIAYKIEI